MIRVAIVFLVAVLIGCTATAPTKPKSLEPRVVVLRADNTVQLQGGINDETADKVQRQLIELDSALPEGEPIFLVLNTPGGELVAGMRIVETAQSLQREVITITMDANSMGFFITQHLGTRLITPSGHMMAHEPTIGVVGMIRKEFVTRLRYKLAFVEAIESAVAKRMKISLFKYREAIKDELHLVGEEAVQKNAADGVALIACERSLVEKLDETIVMIPPGIPVRITRSSCPLLPEIIDVQPVE